MLKANAAAASKKAGAASANAAAAAAAAASAAGRVSLSQLTALTRDDAGEASFTHNSPALTAVRQSPLLVVDVWASNVRSVFSSLACIVDEYPYVAMDTEFPGIVARPLTAPAAGGQGGAAAKSHLAAYHYQTIKLNVELLRLLQLGLCFANEQGEVSQAFVNPQAQTAGSSPPLGVVYQFHFKFSLDHDLYAPDSIALLQSSGLDLARHQREGIEVSEFAELLMTSGIVLNEEVRWLTYHAGFDFAYLLHVLIGGGQGAGGPPLPGPNGEQPPPPAPAQSLPATESEFFELISLYFPCIYDVKALVQSIPSNPVSQARDPVLAGAIQTGGLESLASRLGVARIGGQAHQAGSDSLLTAAVFFRLREIFFPNIIPPTVAQLQQAAAEREKDSSASGGVGLLESALTQAHLSNEEPYLNVLYGLAPLANQLLRSAREKERAMTSAGHTEKNNDDEEQTNTQQTTQGGTTTRPVRAPSSRNDRD